MQRTTRTLRPRGRARAQSEPAAPPADFLLEDYKLKVAWLTAQYDRVLRRSQLFLTLETAGAGAIIVGSKDGGLSEAAPALAVLMALVSVAWLSIGRADRCILRRLNGQLRADGKALAQREGLTSYVPVAALPPVSKDYVPGRWDFIVETDKPNDPPLSMASVPAVLVAVWTVAAVVLAFTM